MNILNADEKREATVITCCTRSRTLPTIPHGTYVLRPTSQFSHSTQHRQPSHSPYTTYHRQPSHSLPHSTQHRQLSHSLHTTYHRQPSHSPTLHKIRHSHRTQRSWSRSNRGQWKVTVAPGLAVMMKPCRSRLAFTNGKISSIITIDHQHASHVNGWPVIPH